MRSLVAVSGGVLALIPMVFTVTATEYDSTADELIGTLSSEVIVLAVAVTLIFEGALLYGIVRYRNSGNAQSPEYNPRLYVFYVLAVGLILFFVGFASFQTLVALDQQGSNPPSEDAVQVDVVAEQFVWRFEYPDENVTSQGTLVIPENETIHLRLISNDVIHSFHSPELGLKQDANPGQWNTLMFTPTNAGEYRLFCAEYCGQGHSAMLGNIRVVDGSEYDNWLDEQRNNSTANETGQSERVSVESTVDGGIGSPSAER